MNISRRNFVGLLGLTGLALSGKGAGSNRIFAQNPEPKSIHTWLETDKTQIYAYDVDVRINDFPEKPELRWLYYLSLQVNFTGHDEWSHGGLQWSHTKEFRNNGNKGINWGGGSDWAGYGGIGSTNTPFTWDLGKWYRYRVWRLKKESDGLWRWLFSLKDYETGKEGQYGTVRTKSEWIKSAVVFTETGYGVGCETERVDVEWRNPTFRHTGGTAKPEKGTANYNGTCQGAFNTQQGLITKSPLQWFHATNSRRTTAPNTRLWEL
jgi:hypothetical protein